MCYLHHVEMSIAPPIWPLRPKSWRVRVLCWDAVIRGTGPDRLNEAVSRRDQRKDVRMATGEIQAILFDKDGTLFDFDATWGV